MEDKIKDLDKSEVDASNVDVYEVGYHLLPTINEDEIPKETAKIQSLLSEKGASIISEEFPTLRALAYDISKQLETKYTNYSKAYFGWIKFELPKNLIEEVDLALKKNTSVLRYIVVKTVRENTMSPMVKVQMTGTKKEVSDTPEVAKVEISEAEIDKSIDELVI